MRHGICVLALLIAACGGVDSSDVTTLQQACRTPKKITICHVPPGNPSNAHTITISEHAWPLHAKHGDTVGPCQFCGDGECNGSADENCSTCELDCGECLPPPPFCGDESCNGEETCRSCEVDCGACPPPPPFCGDEVCDGDESCETCEVDCGACPPPPPYCGDEVCDDDESCSICRLDCGECPPPPPFCGDTLCNGSETCNECESDCGPCPPQCGDGVCDESESCADCDVDCGACCDLCPTPVDEDDYAVVGGGGCSYTGKFPQSGFPWAIALLIALGFSLSFLAKRSRAGALIAILTIITFTSGIVWAAKQIPVDNFRPTTTYGDYYQTYSTQGLGYEKFSLRVMYDYAHTSLQLKNMRTGERVTLLDARHSLRVLGALSLRDYLEIQIALPIILGQVNSNLVPVGSPGENVGGGAGDLRFAVKARLWTKDWFNLGFVVPVSLPTGDEYHLRGRGSVLLTPGITLEGIFDSFSVGLNTGMMLGNMKDVRLTPTQKLEQDISWYGSAALKVNVIDDRLDLVSDLFGSVSVERLGPGQSNLEWLSGLRGRIWKGLYAEAAFGVGLADGVGTPAFRGLTSIGFDFGWTEPAPVVVVEETCVIEETRVIAVIEKVETLIFPSVYFDTDKDVVIPQSEPLLDEIAETLVSRPKVVIVIVEGHADTRLSDEYNLDLAKRRAENVKNELVKRGVAAERIKTKSFGESRPAAPNDSLHNMAKNRRVDVTIGEVRSRRP